MVVDGTEARRAEVGLLTDFVADQGLLLGRRYTTVEAKLYGIKWCHLARGLADPLREAPLVKLALRGLRRIQGDRPCKLPVTVGMLQHIRRYLDPFRAEHKVLWAALMWPLASCCASESTLRTPGATLTWSEVWCGGTWLSGERGGRCRPTHRAQSQMR